MSESVEKSPQRRAVVVAAVVLAVVLAAVVLALLVGRDGEEPSAAASSPAAGASPSPTGGDDGTPTPSPSGSADSADSADSTAKASDGDPTSKDSAKPQADGTTYTENELPPVAPDETAEGTDGVTAQLRKIEYVTGKAVAAGEISGPAVRLTVRLTNDTDEPLDLSYVAVNAYVGPDRAPASTFVRPGAKPFGGVLEPGESGAGVVLFAISEEQSDDVTVTVDYGADVPALAFQGAFEG